VECEDSQVRGSCWFNVLKQNCGDRGSGSSAKGTEEHQKWVTTMAASPRNLITNKQKATCNKRELNLEIIRASSAVMASYLSVLA
jgi:hypothetical protein